MQAIPNLLSCLRIVLSLVLLGVQPLSGVFYILYIICGISDMVDGALARKLGATSALGAKFDGVADMVMIAVIFYILYPFVNLEAHMIIWILVIGSIKIGSIAVILTKYKTFSLTRTYGNRMTGLLMFLLPLLLPFTSATVFIYIICVLASAAAIEEFLINLTSAEFPINKQTIFK